MPQLRAKNVSLIEEATSAGLKDALKQPTTGLIKSNDSDKDQGNLVSETRLIPPGNDKNHREEHMSMLRVDYIAKIYNKHCSYDLSRGVFLIVVGVKAWEMLKHFVFNIGTSPPSNFVASTVDLNTKSAALSYGLRGEGVSHIYFSST